ncbi:MAG: bifunctional DNA primase/polymerase, partial [Candidatus Peribacteraceae bacterium]|nr:bifunctional DNA primase/polymerase [Candidatus Peribacteraceae bacterium]
MEWSNKDYALHYHREINLMPIPVSGKQSLVAWKEYQDKVAPEHIVRDWFLKHINAGIAILTGPVSNVLVLDLDGQQAIDLISTKYPVPKTWMVQTRKGRHLYFKWDKRINFPTVIVKLCGMGSKKGETPEWGVDVRGHGGYVVAPPSEGVYHWLPGYAPWEVNLAPLPDWLFSLLTFHNKSEQEGSTTQPEKTWLTELLEGVGQGERHGALAKLSGY